MPKSIGRKGIIAIVLALIAVIGVASLAFFTDRVDHSMQFTTASFSADGYKLTRTAPEGPFCAGEEVTATLKESNTGDDDVNSIISMKATWVSPDTSLSIFGNANAADNATLSIGGTKVDYTVNAGNKSISFDLPKQVLAAGTKDAARDLTLTIPASFKSTGRIEFTFEKVVVAQEGGGFSKEYSRTDLNAASDLDYSVKVGWAASSIEAQNGKALMGYLTDRNSSGKFGIEFELAFNYTESPMKDFSSRTGAKWSYYKGAVDRLTFVEGMTTIGDYAFPDFSAVKSVSFPTTVKTIGISAFDASGLTGTVTIPATVKEIKSLAFGNLPNVKTFTFGHTTDSLTLPDNTAAGKRNTGAFYVPTHVDTTVNTTVEAIMYGYKWHDGYDNRRLVPTLNAQDTWFRTGSTAKLDEDVLENITFADYHMPVTGETSWDASDPSVPGTVTAFLSADKKSLILAGNGYGLVFANEDSSGAFGNLTALKTVSNTNLLDTRNATTMADMFNFDKKLANISVTTWNVSKVTDMSNMFYCCDSLPSIDLKPNTCTAKDGSGQYTAWNTASLKNTSGMFMDYGGENHALTTVDTTGWDTSKLEDTSYMFMECRGLTAVKGIESWNVSNLKTANNMFQDCQSLQTINVSDWNTASLENTSVMFSSCKALKNIDISKWDMSKVTRSEDASQTMSEAMFAYCESLTELTLPKSLTVVGDRFAAECPKLATITFNHPAGTAVQLGSDAFIVNDNGKDEGATGYVKYTPVAPLGTKVVTSNDQVLGYDWTSDHRGYKVEIKNVEGGTLTGAPLTTYNGQKAVVAINGKTITFTPSNVNAYNGVTIQYSQGGTTKTVTLDKNTMTWTMPAVDDKASEADVVVTPKGVVPVLAEKGTWYKGTTAKSTITEIELVDTYTATGNEAESWDASAAQDGGVKAYINGTKLIIAGNGYGKVLANADSTSAFNAFTNLTSFTGLNKLDTSNVTNMQTMFAGCKALTSVGDISGWNTANVTDMQEMFNNCLALKSLNLSGWNTANVTDMFSMFYFCNTLTSLDVSGWNTSNVTCMSFMFAGCPALASLDLSGFDTSKVTLMADMFDGCTALTSVGDLSGWNTANVTNMKSMFEGCSSLTGLDLSGWDTSNVTTMEYMFSGCRVLQTVTLGKNFKFGSTSSYLPTPSSTYITGANGKWYDTSDGTWYTPAELASVTRTEARTYVAVKPAPTLAAGYSWYKGSTAKSTITAIEIKDSYTPSGTPTESWNADVDNSGSIKAYVEGTKLTIAGNGAGKIMANADSTSAFSCDIYAYEPDPFASVTAISGLDKLDTSNVTDMATMFLGCSSLTSLDLSGFNTSKVTNMGNMFGGCSSLTSLDLSGFDTSKVTNMGNMFGSCEALTSLDVSGWNTSNVTNMQQMFYYCKAMVSLDLSGWNTSNVTTMQSMFWYCSKLTSVGDLSGWNTANVTDMEYMFNYCEALTSLDLSGWNTSNVTTMRQMFRNCKALTSVGDLSGFNTSNVTNMYFMFEDCNALTSVGDLSGWNTSKVTNMGGMFFRCYKLTSLDLSGWDTSNVTNMGTMFYNCTALTGVGNLSGWDTSNVTDMQQMFDGCNALTSLDVSGWNTSNVTTMQQMFKNCKAMVSLDISGWDTSNVTIMYMMFSDCTALTKIYASDLWSTAGVTNARDMFLGCSKLSGAISYNSSKVDATYANYTTGYLTYKAAPARSMSIMSNGSEISGYSISE